MAITPKVIVASQVVGGSASVFYTAPSSTQTVIKQFTLTNYSGSAVTVSVWLTPTAAAPTDAQLLIDEKALAAGEAWSAWPAMGQVLDTNNSIQVSASAIDSVSIRVSGIEVV